MTKAWRIAIAATLLVWVAAMARLFIADVWDETNALVVFGDPSQSAGRLIATILKTPLPFWRPIPTIFAALVIHALPFGAAWVLLRIVNMLTIVAAILLLIRALRAWDGEDFRRDAVFLFAALFSAGAVIVAGWFANIFDASAMLLLACGIVLLTRRWFLEAGLVFGFAFFFKETAALALPFVVWLAAIGRLRWREAMKVIVPAMTLGVVYFVLRGLVVPLGSAADTHQFAASMIVPTARGLVESYWRETLWNAPSVAGYVVFLFSFAALRGWRSRAAFLGFLACNVVIYLSMFATYQGRTLIHYLMFVPRLYFIPVTLTLFVFALQRRTWAIAVLAIPLLLGATATYVGYARFQRAYAAIYRTEPKPLRIDYAGKPLHDPIRRIDIGDFPDAPLRLDPFRGQLVRRR